MTNRFFSRPSAFLCLVIGLSLPLAPSWGKDRGLTIQELLQGIAHNYASLQIADLQLARAQQELAKVESQLGWNLSAGGRIARDVSAFGVPTDVYSAQAGLSRKYDSGGSLEFSGNLSREDAETVFFPGIPDPLDSAGLGVSYRQPFARGKDNPGYALGQASAEADSVIADIERSRLRDSVAERASGLFYLIARTLARLDNANQSIQRARKLKQYIQSNLDLGIAERKDILQVQAQIDAREADYQGLKVAWEQLRNQLNRLMLQPMKNDIKPRLDTQRVKQSGDRLQEQALAHNADSREAEVRLQELDAVVAARQDAAKDKIDLIYSTGVRRRAGDSSTSDEDVVAGVALEYGKSLDRRGLDAELYQARVDQDIQRLRLAETENDIRYSVQGYIVRITAARSAMQAYRQSKQAEKAKLEEATQRYRDGRESTDRLIQFETEYHAAELNYQLQRVDLAEMITGLRLLTGELWSDVEFPQAKLPE